MESIICCLLSLQNWYVTLALTFPLTGFVQSLEFLKKSWSLPSNFPDLEKVWKMEKKSGKMVNDGLEFFFKATTSALEVNLFRFVQILFIQINPYVCSVQWKNLCSCILKISVDYLPWAWKKKSLLWKKVWKKTGILDPKICSNPVLTSVPLTFESLSNS